MEDVIYPKIKNVILLCLLKIGVELGVGIILGIVLKLLGYETSSLVYRIGQIIVHFLSYAIVIYIGWKKTKASFNHVFKFNKVSIDLWIYTIVFSFGFIILSSEIGNIINFILPTPAILDNLFNRMFNEQNVFVAFIQVGMIPALVEEMTFRGLVLNGFSKVFPMRKSILISALIFGLIHFNPWQFITAFYIGIFLGWIFYKTESILLCIYFHLSNNTVILLITKFPDFILFKGFNTNDKLSVQFHAWWLDVIGVFLAIIGFVLLEKATRTQNKRKMN